MWTNNLLLTSKNIHYEQTEPCLRTSAYRLLWNLLPGQDNPSQLVNDFNKLAGSRGWTAERSYYSVALTNEMLRRGMDLSAISETDNISGKIISVRLRNVRYDEALNKLMLIQ